MKSKSGVPAIMVTLIHIEYTKKKRKRKNEENGNRQKFKSSSTGARTGVGLVPAKLKVSPPKQASV
jgi:hypothetical protein